MIPTEPPQQPFRQPPEEQTLKCQTSKMTLHGTPTFCLVPEKGYFPSKKQNQVNISEQCHS